ncbi:MAG: EAL domain-containing protein [Halioglobus sp.]|nr:EAL domain-containing protein [Halioglobus sp.]
MEGSEELRETLVSMRREIGLLRTEATHANLLLEALDAMLNVNGEEDPFVGVFSALLPVFDCEHAIVLIENTADRDRLKCIASNRASVIGSFWNSGQKLEKVLAGRILTTLSGADDEGWPDIEELRGSQPALYLPLGVRERRGLMMLLRENHQHGFDRTHVTLARKFSLLASHALAAKHASQTEAESHRLKHLTEELKASKEALTFRANHDQLTGLPNRTYIAELVNGILARRQPGHKVALAFLDLDNFKRVNDFYGHTAGDLLLKSVAQRLRDEIRDTDIIGRISGDEFVIVFDPFERQAELSAVVSRVSAQLRNPFNIGGQEIRTSGSIGVAIWPAHGHDYDTLRSHADAAMYQTKTAYKGSVTFFSPALGREMSQRLSLEHRLRAALSQREFHCALQQKVDLRTHDIVGFEALVRWVDSHGTIHPPAKFLQLAGELGLLDAITDVMLDVMSETLSLLDLHFGAATQYSVNISAAQATKTPFMRRVVQRIADTGRPECFLLELTEESFLPTGTFVSDVLPLIREAGLGVSIDDFGTGYSSLAILADITADELKVDRSLITAIHQRPRSQGILRAIESLGASLNMSVVAEGVETIEERDYLLHSTGIEIGQGYLFHKPQLLSEIIGAAV